MQTKKPENPKISWLEAIIWSGLSPFSVKNYWKFTDNYADMNGAGQKHGSFWTHVQLCADTLEEVVADASVKIFAEFISDLLRIRYKLTPEINAFCWGQDEKLRSELKNMEIAPFTEMGQWYSQSYLKGFSLGGNTFGITLEPVSNGVLTRMWETNHNPQIMAEMINSHPELKAVFSENCNGSSFQWGYPGVIPFDSIIDWLKDLLKLLKSLQ